MSTPNFRINNKSGSYIIVYGARLDEILKGPNGSAIRDMMRRAEKLQNAAKRQIRLGHIHGGEGHGNLRDSLVKRVATNKAGTGMPYVLVGSSHPRALLHHNGARRHIIRPVRRKFLRFPGNTKSGWVYAKIVHHPGTKPNKYLTDNLHLVGG